MDTSLSSKVQSSSIGTNVQVAVRCRPLNTEEKRTSQPCVVACDTEGKTVKVSYGSVGKKSTKSFNFDRVFGMYSTQEEVFEQVVRPIVDEALAGFNCTIFAYGQTGTGKTHTMEGDIHSEENAGIVPRCVKAILDKLNSSEFTIRVSFLELYNEELQDLLNTTGEKKLKLCEDVKKGVVCQNLEEITVLNLAQIFEILQRGIQQRQTAATLCNKNSSRSHSIFTLKIMIKESNVDGEEVVRHGQLNLVDLAGSECVGRSGAKNDRAREAGNINASLLTLGRVITALVDHHGHIPYRDSKLTRLLQESLGGKAKTCIIATLSPSQGAVEETLSTLDYAHRAKNIKNKPTVNESVKKVVILKEYCAEIETLKYQLQITREKNGIYVEPADFYGMEAKIATQESQLQDCEAALRQAKEEVKILRSERDDWITRLDNTRQELDDTREHLDGVKEALDATEKALTHTRTELAANEAVVREQSATEQCLMDLGTDLQGEVTTHRNEIEALLEKVNTFTAAEETSIAKTAEMVADVQSRKAELDASMAQFLGRCEDQSTFLRGGVVDMLDRSRDTCGVLRKAIDDALKSLIADAQAAKDTMTSSCDGLDQHLRSTNNHIEMTLRAVQERLSSWLGEVDSSIAGARELLATQQSQLDVLAAEIRAQAQAYVHLSGECAQAQEAGARRVRELSRGLEDDLAQRLRNHQQQQEAHAAAMAQALNAQATAMEAAMKKMLTEMLQSSLQGINTFSTSSSQFCGETASASETTLAALNQSMASYVEANQGYTDRLAAMVSGACSAQLGHVESSSMSRAAVDAHLQSVSGSVVPQRAHLNTTVRSLLTDVGTAIDQGCAVVGTTSQAAAKILRDVTSATEAMESSSGAAMQTFTTFLDEKGEKISRDLTTHFADLQEHVSTQQGQLQVMGSNVRRFGDVIVESKVAPSGGTPRKRNFSALRPLTSTRPHTIIKDEVRSQMLVCASGLSSDNAHMVIEQGGDDLKGSSAVHDGDEDDACASGGNSKRSSKSSSHGDGDEANAESEAAPVRSSTAENSHPNTSSRLPVAGSRAAGAGGGTGGSKRPNLHRAKSMVEVGESEPRGVTTRTRSASATAAPAITSSGDDV